MFVFGILSSTLMTLASAAPGLIHSFRGPGAGPTGYRIAVLERIHQKKQAHLDPTIFPEGYHRRLGGYRDPLTAVTEMGWTIAQANLIAPYGAKNELPEQQRHLEELLHRWSIAVEGLGVERSMSEANFELLAFKWEILDYAIRVSQLPKEVLTDVRHRLQQMEDILIRIPIVNPRR